MSSQVVLQVRRVGGGTSMVIGVATTCIGVATAPVVLLHCTLLLLNTAFRAPSSGASYGMR